MEAFLAQATDSVIQGCSNWEAVLEQLELIVRGQHGDPGRGDEATVIEFRKYWEE